MKVIVVHSPHERCGIAEYGRQLDMAMLANDLVVEPCDFDDFGPERVSPGSVVFVHFEPALVPVGFLTKLAETKARGGYVVVCCHYYAPTVFSQVALRTVDRFVVHRRYEGLSHPKFIEVPLGCPVYDVVEGHTALRQKYGLPSDKKILTTLGFLTPWKKIPDLVKTFLEQAPKDVFFQVVTPRPFSGDGAAEEAATRDAVAGSEDRVFFSTEFRSERELLDRVRASTLGVLYHSQHTGSVSAATKQFVSARTPLVATTSSHASDVHEGVLRVGAGGVIPTASETIEAALRVLDNTDVLRVLRDGVEREYQRLNMNAVAARYATLFGEISR